MAIGENGMTLVLAPPPVEEGVMNELVSVTALPRLTVVWTVSFLMEVVHEAKMRVKGKFVMTHRVQVNIIIFLDVSITEIIQVACSKMKKKKQTWKGWGQGLCIFWPSGSARLHEDPGLCKKVQPIHTNN